MIARLHGGGRSFRGVVAYCLGEKRLGEDESREDRDPEARLAEEASREDRDPEQAGRVEWTATVNMATDDPRRAAREMSAVANYAPDLKRLSGIGAGGRKLEKPVAHYTLSWAEGETPDPRTQGAAVLSSLKVLGLDDRQSVIVAHNDGRTPHVHVVANRVSPEDGRAAKLSQDRLKLSRWAEGYEREQGQIRCPRRVEHNRRRSQGEFVQDRESQSNALFYRLPAVVPEVERIGRAMRTGDLQALAEYGDPNEAFRRLCQLKREGDRTQRERKRALDRQHRGGWRELYRRQDGERSGQAEDCQSLRGRVQQWREYGSRWRDLPGAIRGKAGVLDEWSRRLDQRHRQERAGQGREHTRAVREQGVSRPRRLGYREERFEAIQQARQGLAFLTLPGTQPLGGPEVTTEAYAKLQGLIQSLPERDRKELERRDQRMKQGFERVSQPPSSTPVRPSLTDQMKTYRQSIPPDHVELDAKPTTNLPGGPIAYKFEGHPMPQDLKGLAKKDFGYNQVIAHAPLTEVQNHFRSLSEADRPTFDTGPSR